MKLRFLAAALLVLGLGQSAHAGLLRFDTPDPIAIDANNVATYTEAGFTLSSQAPDFLLLDDGAGNGMLVGGFFGAGPVTLKAAGGGLFSLLSLDFGYFDLGDPPGLLAITGLLNGQQVATQTLTLGALASVQFGSPWASLSEVMFSATSGFQLDNIAAAVPEPGSMVLLGLGLSALASRRRKAAL